MFIFKRFALAWPAGINDEGLIYNSFISIFANRNRGCGNRGCDNSERYEQLRTLIRRDYATFSGLSLERYFRAKAIESKQYTMIGRWWDRKGENEIDMIAANELDKRVEIYEIKRNRKNIDFKSLENKAENMLGRVGLFNGYKVEIKGLDMQDM